MKREELMSVLCPKCFEQTETTLKASLVREEMTCRKCHFIWLERSQELKRHKNERLGRLEKVENAVMQRRCEKLDESFNDGTITPQEYALRLKELELQNVRVCATLNTLWSKRL